MQKEHELIKQVYAAKENAIKADELIRSYIPFIKKEVAKFISRICTEQDDEYSIALMAFHEAVLSYEKEKGAFLSYASLTIRSRLIDFQRKEARHQGHISLNDENVEDDAPLQDKIADERDYYSESAGLAATKQEIEELSQVMKDFGVALSDVADNSPKQDRTLNACAKIVQYAVKNKDVLDELLKTKKLPISRLSTYTGVEKKTLERHRKYIITMLLIQTNGYEIIRAHIKGVLIVKGGV